MAQERSTDPFSIFLNTTSRPQVHMGAAQSSEPLPPVAMAVLTALRDRPRTQVDALRLATGLTTLRIAEVVSMLLRLELISVHGDGADDEVELTARGRELLAAR
ncbi:hypothetical protein [Streptomyces sp. NPDC050355]|uniref:MarR family transcriptional regulator n=1 Tax=Streptomyces sirii TaxID=3127701 RepID=A0ABZ2QGZ7_9ACTN